MLRPDSWYDGFQAQATEQGTQANSTINTYLSHAKCLRERFFNGATCCKIICHGQEAAHFLVDLALREEAEGIIKRSTLAGYVEGLLAIVGVMAPPDFKDTLAKEHMQAWKDAYRAIRNSVVEPRNQGIPTKRQVAGYTPLQKIIACRDALPLHSRARLLLEVYTRIPPVRLDHGATKIFKLAPGQQLVEMQGWTGNYLVLDMSKQNSYIHIVRPNKNFNRPAYAQGVRAAVPNMLQAVIEASLAEYPRDYLFTAQKGGARTNKPFDTENGSSFSRFVCGVLKNHVGNLALTHHLLRNIYTIGMYQAYAPALLGQEGEEAQAFARDQVSKAAFLMVHSVSEHGKYRFKTDSGPDPEEYKKLTALKLPVLSVEARKQPVAIVDFTSALESHVE